MLAQTAQQVGYPAELLAALECVNERQKQTLFTKLQHAFSGELNGKNIAVCGLAFKPNTYDIREAPCRVLMEALWQAGAQVRAFDPEAMEETARIYGEREELTLCSKLDDTLHDADAPVIYTEWQQFRGVDLQRLAREMKMPVIIDGRNLFSPQVAKEAGISYVSVGR